MAAMGSVAAPDTVATEVHGEIARASGRGSNWPRMRPRFIAEVDCRVEEVMAALAEDPARSAAGIEGRFSERHGVLRVDTSERRFWSTQLGITIEAPRAGADGPEVPTRVLGVFSPHPEIWTGYVFAVGTLAGISVFGVVYAIVQLSMGNAPWCLLGSVIATLLGALVYTSTLVGQGLTADEMYRLRRYLDQRLGAAESRARTAAPEPMDRAHL